jgi:hypothetical protein
MPISPGLDLIFKTVSDHYSSLLDEGADDSASVGGEGSEAEVRDVFGNGLGN